MNKHHTATISLDGVEILSYRGCDARILSPSTMPWQVAGQLAEALGLTGVGAAIGSGKTEVREVRPRVYETTGDVHVSMGRRVSPDDPGYAGPNHTTYVDVPSVVVQWVGTSDYTPSPARE